VSRFQVSPPSVDFQIPPFGPPLSRPQVRMTRGHMPANRIRGFFMSMAISKQPVFSSAKSTCSQVFPPSFVR